MNREDQIKAALKIIKPKDRVRCEHLLNMALDNLAVDKAEEKHTADVISKHAMIKLRAYHKKLRLAESAYKSLPPGMKENLAFLDRLHRDTSTTDASALFPNLIADCNRILARSRNRAIEGGFCETFGGLLGGGNSRS